MAGYSGMFPLFRVLVLFWLREIDQRLIHCLKAVTNPSELSSKRLNPNGSEIFHSSRYPYPYKKFLGQTIRGWSKDKAQLQQYLKDGYDNNKLDVPVLSTCHGLPISEIFAPVILTANTEPAPKQRTRESGKLRSYKAMFFKENVLQKKLFLLGKAGVGKSTFCKHLCDIWCNDKVSPQFGDAGVLKQFRYLFNVSCRFAEASESIFDMICNQLFCENDEMIKVACHVLKNTPDECLVVVDGIDEWKGSAKEEKGRRGDIPGLPSRKGLEGCVVLSTSRPERIHKLPVKLDDTCSVFELHGIENAGELIYSILEKVENPNPRQSCSKFLSQIKQSKMTDLIQFPLMLINALNIWDRNETLSSSMCVNYSNMLEGLFLRAKDANRIGEYERRREKEKFAELPDCFIDTDLCKQNAGLIIKLGKVAFDLLYNDDQNLSLIFSGQQSRKYLTEIELKTSLAVGILSKAQTISRSRRKIDSFSFCHKTFQEFLGALWLSTEQSKIMGIFLRQFRSTDTLHKNEVFIQFLCGLSPSTGGKFWQYIVDEVIEKDKDIINMRWKGIGYDQYSFRYKIRMLQDLVLQCIEEARSSDREQHQQLYYFFPDICIDKFIDERDITLIYGMMEKFVTNIKSVALSHNIPSKIVKLMKKMKSAIAIVLHGEYWPRSAGKTMPELCSDNQEVPVLQFPHQLKTLRIRRVAMTTSEVEFPSHLTTLAVNETELSHRVIEQLFSCIRVSSNLQDLCLESLHCSDHGDSCCLPALDLQKHHSLEEVILEGLSVKSVLMPGQETIPLHLTKLSVSSIQMSHSGIAQFCSWFGDSSTLKYVKLENVSCSDHDYSCCLPALDLQKHHSLEEVILEGLSVKSVLMPGQETIPLHLTKLSVSSIQMSHSGIAQFCSWFGDSSTLKYVKLENVSCSDHDYSCCLPALDLQKHHSLEEMKLERLSVKSVLMPGQETIPLHLTKLTVSSIQMPHSGIAQFCSWFGDSSTLKYLDLQSLSCSDHGDSCCLPALDLQKHHSLEEVILEGLSVKSVLMPGQETIPLHLTKLSVSSIQMSHSGIAQFCSWFGDSSTLKYVKLENVSCSDHDYSCCLPALDLQRHLSLEKVKLERLSVKSVLMPGQETIPLHLTKLTVSSIQMSHSGIAQFCSWFGDSSTLKYLEIESVSCSDHGDSCLPALELQKHHSLEEVILEGLSVKSVPMPGQGTIPLHLTKLTVSSIQMSHSGIAQFCSWFGDSSTLKYLEIESVSCSDHGDSCCLPVLELQKHHSLEEVILEGLSVKSVPMPGQGTIPLHLTKLTVSSIQMSHSGIAQFCSWFGDSSTLKYLEIESVSCSDHGDSCCLPALELQKHHSLEKVELRSLSVESVLQPGQLERHQTSGLHKIPSMSIFMVCVKMSPHGWKRCVDSLPHLSRRLDVALFSCNIDKDFRSFIRSSSHFKVTKDDESWFWFSTTHTLPAFVGFQAFIS